MYSLYRAWLSMSHQPSTPTADLQAALPLNLSAAPLVTSGNAPDVQLQVGPSLTNFSAHRNVLSAHSGFFKAALTNGSGPILVPNIQVDEFSSLLTFMYTGYLDLNLANIYNILLATHILHMPRALELCRNFLMQTQHQHMAIDQRPSTSIIKPIASRKPLPNISAIHPQFQQGEAPMETKAKRRSEQQVKANISISNNETSVFKKINPNERSDVAVAGASTSSTTTTTTTTTTSPNKDHKLLSKVAKSPADVVKTCAKSIKAAAAATKRRHNPALSVASAATAQHHQQEERIIIDIACCDGPVRFHRVINNNYGGGGSRNQNQEHNESGKGKAIKHIERINTAQAMNKVMSENIKMADCPTANGKQLALSTAQNEENAHSNSNSGDFYTCLYCNHTFKSQYCYQKHARRHLNPVDDSKMTSTSVRVPECNHREGGNACKREFKLLDMNVQYYPCKTCGSKFPSYYFVHKHRKLCHADEMADGSNKNNEIVQVKPQMSDDNMEVEDAEQEQDAKVQEDAAENSNSSDTNHSNASCSNKSDIIDVEETND